MTSTSDKFAQLGEAEFTRLMNLLCDEMNLGAGIQISGDSGSGKSNLGEHLFVESFERGIPSIYFDPHGDSANKIHRMLLERSRSQTQKTLLFLRPSDLSTTFGFNPLRTYSDPEDIVPYQAEIEARVQETAKIIMSLFGEAEFEGRTKLRRYLTMWLASLARSGLTLADAPYFADPDSPIYQQLIELAPNQTIRNKMAFLVGRKPTDLENEIGSTEVRVVPVLSHPVANLMFSRRENNLDFRWIIENDMSVLVDLSKSGQARGRGIRTEYPAGLTSEVQQLICNLMLTQYINTIKSVPFAKRKQRMVFIDELPVFESSATLLTEMCTEARKFLTKFVFMHQGSTRFPGGHDNEFFQAIYKMCTASVFFRHSGEDAKYFAESIARQAYDRGEMKYEHWVDREFSLDPEIIELTSTTAGTSTNTSSSQTTGSTHQSTDTAGNAEKVVESVMDKGHATKSATSGTAVSDSSSTQTSTGATSTNSTTKSQALKPRNEIRSVLQSVEFASIEEQAMEAIKLVETFPTGECVVQVAGIGTSTARAPEAIEQLADLSTIVDRYVEEFFTHQLAQPWFSDTNEQLREREAFQQSISDHLQHLIEERKIRINPRVAETESTKAIELHPAHDSSQPPAGQPERETNSAASKANPLDPDWYDDGEF